MRLLILFLALTSNAFASDSLRDICLGQGVGVEHCLNLIREGFNLRYAPSENVTLDELDVSYADVVSVITEGAGQGHGGYVNERSVFSEGSGQGHGN